MRASDSASTCLCHAARCQSELQSVIPGLDSKRSKLMLPLVPRKPISQIASGQMHCVSITLVGSFQRCKDDAGSKGHRYSHTRRWRTLCRVGSTMKTKKSPPIVRMPQLPQEIWAITASKMSTRDWMSVSRTSRLMYSLQPASIILVPRQTRDSRWLVKHWKQDCVLLLDMQHTSNRNIAKCATAMLAEVNQLSQLRYLKLRAPVDDYARCDECIVEDHRIEYGIDYNAHGDGPCPGCEQLQRSKGDELKWTALLAIFVQQAGHIEISGKRCLLGRRLWMCHC